MKKVYYLFLIAVFIFSLAACGQENESNKTAVPKSETQQLTQDSEIKKSNKQLESNLSAQEFFEPFTGKIDHIHGLGYVGNQNVVFVAAHDGLKVYDHGKWYRTMNENNDYMGFNAVKAGFYSSGHPGSDSKLPNPIGIKKSQDNGETLENLALEGEVDFHAMGVGYENNVIFVMSPHKNSMMEANKFYISEDDAKSWQEVTAKGIGDEIMSIAVHPTNSETMAIAGKEGIYLSKDKGESFELITEGSQGTAVYLTKDSLYYGAFNGNALFVKRSLADSSEQVINLPKMKKDAVMYIARNPQAENEMTFASFNGNIYQTRDGANTWNQIVKEGEIQ